MGVRMTPKYAGSSFRVHDGLAEVFPSRFPTHPAAIECHMTLSLKHQMPKTMQNCIQLIAELHSI